MAKMEELAVDFLFKIYHLEGIENRQTNCTHSYACTRLQGASNVILRGSDGGLTSHVFDLLMQYNA
jgi:hypothetical protein